MPVATGEEQRESLQDVVTRNMRVAMALRGVNQTKLAEALGVDRSAISQKMTRRVAWSLEDIEKASGFFKVNPEALVAGHGFEPWTSPTYMYDVSVTKQTRPEITTGELIKRLLAFNGLTQQDMADTIGCSRSSVSQKCAGHVILSADVLLGRKPLEVK